MAAAPSPPPTSAPAEDVLPLAAAAAPPAPAPEKEDGGAAGAGAGVSAAGPLPPLQGEGAQCDTCTSAAPRYRCPACHVRSCSLACVKAHKAQKGCDGRAPRTRFAAHVSELPENVLWHDFCLLEDASRFVGAADRTHLPGQPSLSGSAGSARNFKRRKNQKPPLVRAAERQGIQLELQPPGMTRHEKNTTQLTRRHELLWRIDWVFQQPGICYTMESALGSKTLAALLDEYLAKRSDNALQRHRVAAYWQRRGETSVLMQDLRRPSHEKRFVKLDVSLPLNKALSGTRVIEFPTLYVQLPEEQESYPLAEAFLPGPVLEPKQPKAKHAKRAPDAEARPDEGAAAATPSL